MTRAALVYNRPAVNTKERQRQTLDSLRRQTYLVPSFVHFSHCIRQTKKCMVNNSIIHLRRIDCTVLASPADASS